MTVLAFAAESALLDIEGTISPQTYVRDVLFPYSRARLAEFVREREGAFEVASILEDARRESGRDDAVAALLDWQDRDVKATPLKALQGLIWERGYAAGDFVSPDLLGRPGCAPSVAGQRRSPLRLLVRLREGAGPILSLQRIRRPASSLLGLFRHDERPEDRVELLPPHCEPDRRTAGRHRLLLRQRR